MAVVARGWSKTASTAVKLATAERIIGYQFNDVDRLYEALDQTKQTSMLPSGKPARKSPRNHRLATLGDAHAKLRMAQQYYDNGDLVGAHWGIIQAKTLSNNQMSEFGFRLGLDECAIPHMIEKEYDMATTVEAVFAAVEMDGAGQEQFHKVMARFGIQHRLVEPIQRRWIYKAVKSEVGLPDRFFIGHHFRLQEGIFETTLMQSTSSRRASAQENIGVRRALENLWKSVTWMWLGSPRKPSRMPPSLRAQKLPELRAARSSEVVEPLAKGPRPKSTGTIATPSKLDEESPGRLEDDRAATPEQTTDRDEPVDKHKAVEAAETAEVSSSETPSPSEPPRSNPPNSKSQSVLPKEDTSKDNVGTAENGVSSSKTPSPSEPPRSNPPNSKSQSVLPKEGTSEDDVGTAENGSQVSNKASIDGSSPEPSNRHGAASDAGLEVGHQAHEVSVAESVEATEADETDGKILRILRKLKQKDKELRAGIREVETTSAQRRLAKKPKSPELSQKLWEIKSRRQRLIKVQESWRKKLREFQQSKQSKQSDQQS